MGFEEEEERERMLLPSRQSRREGSCDGQRSVSFGCFFFWKEDLM